MYCKYCGARIDGDSRFCPQCGSPVQGTGGFRQQERQAPPRTYGQPIRRSAAFDTGRRASRRKSPVSAGFQGRLFGIPISGKAAIIILIILVIVCVILNKTGALS
jgi:uncharacterized membrane protein YvbJ